MNEPENPFAERNLVTLEEALLAGINIQPEYTPITVNGLLVGFEKKGGALDRVEVVVHMDRGKPLYHALARSESRGADGQFPAVTGAVNVPFYLDARNMPQVGLLRQLRRVVRDPVTGKQGEVISPETSRGMSKLGQTSSQTADDELTEETGKLTARKWQIGHVCSDTSFSPYRVPVFAIQIKGDIEGAKIDDPKERIFSSVFAPYSDVKNRLVPGHPDPIFCGYTLSALNFFDTFFCHNFFLGPEGQVLGEKPNTPYKLVA